MARDYGRSIGFKGNFLIEPKPMEPMKHQYDFDSATVVGFLASTAWRRTSSSTSRPTTPRWPGHTFEHDLQVASDHGLLGSIDANRGNAQNGWDTDQFPSDLYDTVGAMLVVLRQGGLDGGLNFDAKVRRESTDLEDLFIAHIGGMDAFARGLEVAHALLNDSPWEAVAQAALCQLRQRRRQGFRGWAASLRRPGRIRRRPAASRHRPVASRSATRTCSTSTCCAELTQLAVEATLDARRNARQCATPAIEAAKTPASSS